MPGLPFTLHVCIAALMTSILQVQSAVFAVYYICTPSHFTFNALLLYSKQCLLANSPHFRQRYSASKFKSLKEHQ
eukprot:19960-Heterococcus_DN1.PRE.2